jgi:very-short-patch-repair endonuclease
MPPPPDTLAGAFTPAAALRHGMSARTVSRRVQRGELTRLHSGVFHASDAGPLTRAGAVVLASGGVASHLTAARVHGLWVVERGDWATVPTSVHRRSTPRLRFHRGDLARRDVTTIGRVPLTTVRRTLRDLCHDASPLQAVIAIESAVRLGRITPEQLATVRQDPERRVRVTAGRADPRSESPLETAARLLLEDAGFSVTPQVEVRDRRGIVRYRLDLRVDGTRVAVECDGREAHDLPDAVYRDRWRANDLAVRWVVLRFTWYDVFARPDYVVAAVRRAVAAS